MILAKIKHFYERVPSWKSYYTTQKNERKYNISTQVLNTTVYSHKVWNLFRIKYFVKGLNGYCGQGFYIKYMIPWPFVNHVPNSTHLWYKAPVFIYLASSDQILHFIDASVQQTINWKSQYPICPENFEWNWKYSYAQWMLYPY